MNRPLVAVLLSTLWLLPTAARAEPTSFSYAWSVSDVSLGTWGPGPAIISSSTAPDGSGLTLSYAGGSATFTVAAPGTATTLWSEGSGPVSSVVVPAGVLTSTFSGGYTGEFSFTASFLLTGKLTDLASGESGDLTTYGYVNGTVGPEGGSLTMSGWSFADAPLSLGGKFYNAYLGGDTAVPPADGNPAVVPFTVAVGDGEWPDYAFPNELPGNGSAHAPEPSSLVLGLTALASLGLRLGRRRVRSA